ncbi:MAG TPA: hypothetical protein VM032_08345 [Vicinamibacterales bacterium]|nr:hypothetical protein [Vicinamibacterales bacterium]
MTKSFYRILAAGLGVLAIAACDARRVTSNSSEDQLVPFIDVSVPGDTSRQFDIGQPLTVNVKASDNLSLLRVEVAVVAGTRLLQLDTVQFGSATPSYTNSFQVSLTGVAAGTRIGIYGIALDGAGNVNRDSMFITTADTSAPIVTLTSPAIDQVFKTDSTIKVGLHVEDNAGITRIGYDILRSSDSTVFISNSVTYAVPPTTKDTVLRFVVPGNMPPGEYFIRGFGVDASGNRGESDLLHIGVRDIIPPTIQFIAPVPDQKFGLQDSILVTVHIQDASGLQRLTLVGISTRGDPAFGIVDTIVRYDSTFAPINVAGAARSFPPGTTDVTVSRWLKPKNPNDTITEPVLIVATVTDISNNTTVAIQRVQLVSGPRITIVRPGVGSVTAAGKIVIIEMAASDKDGVLQVGFNVTSPTFNFQKIKNIAGLPTDVTVIDTLFVPATVTPGTQLLITPVGFDRFGQPGSGSPVIVTVTQVILDTTGPLVYQSFGAKFETDDSIKVRAIDPDGIASIGYQLKDSVGVTRDSGFRTLSGQSSDETVGFQLNVPVELQGGRVRLIAFARDTRANLGYSIPTGTTIAVGTIGAARTDTIDVVFGRTFSLPNGGIGADIAVDTVRKTTFISNVTFDRLEVFENATQKFAARKIAVGADPWGMFIDGDTLLVANSAGTNISRVLISGGAATAAELLSRRIKTPLSVVYDVTIKIASTGGGFNYLVEPYQFSDRPAFVGQMRRRDTVSVSRGAGSNGDIYYSTKPTTNAPLGTIRRYDPYAQESQQIWQYGNKNKTNKGNVAIFNADSVYVSVSTDRLSFDSLYICDHPYGNPSAQNCVGGTDVREIIYGPGPNLRATGSDAVGIAELDVLSLGLTDTTFVATGGDRRWIAFGEGNTGEDNAGRVMMAKDSTVVDNVSGSRVNFFSPSTYVRDLTNNASDQIFGVALNKNSGLVAVHGIESFFSDVPNPYLLRLQGKVNTFSTGAGIAFHPDNVSDDGVSFAAPDGSQANIAFVASANGTIEIMDTFHYTSRGTLPVSASLYGPIRAVKSYATDNPVGMLPTDPNFVVVKLYGLTVQGLIVIDVRNRDIRPL